MNKKSSIFSAFVFLLFVLFTTDDSLAQTKTQDGHVVASTFNGKTYHLDVSLPRSYSSADTVHYPVLYVLDGKFSYQSFKSIREVLDLASEIRQVIIVAIESDVTSDAEWFSSRYADFTPSNVPTSDTQWAKMMNIPAGKLKSGGAARFLSTLENDLVPYINRNYKTSGQQGISGHSLGGLFAGYCLLKKPGLFNYYGINSPSFWWNNNEMLAIERSGGDQKGRMPARVFFSAGALEGDLMIKPMTSFMNALKDRHCDGLQITSQVFEGETHVSVVAACSSRTLKALFGAGIN